jgi:hypothetical protein
MPSTYSPDLRIELIANGEQSGTWGTTTNTNLGTLIEDAISGSASVTIDAEDYALTAANGAADQARCAALVFNTGSWGDAFNIFAPPVTKLYVIKNNTPYGASLYCSTVIGNTTAAGAGYDIPAGKTVFVRCSGTAFTDGINHVQNGFTLDIPLGVTSGGTGLATFPALSIPVANTLNTLSAVTVAANQSVRLNSAGTAWEAFTPSTGAGTVSFTGSAPTGGQVTVYNSSTGTVITTTKTYQFRATSAGQAQIELYERTTNGSDCITIQPPAALAATYTLTLPGNEGTTGQLLTTDGAGVLSWTSPTGAAAGTYGNSTNVAQITVDAQGRISGISNVAISGGGGSVSSVTGSGAITASPTTGAVTVSVATANDTSTAGIVSTTTQTFGGAKTFSSTLTANGFLSSNTAYNYTSTTSTFGSSSAVSFDISSTRAFNITASFINAGFDNVASCGSVGTRWSVVYAATGTINTSDANTKQDIADLDDAEKRVAARIKGLIKKFRFKDAVEAKGAAARIHVGVIAQEVRDAFTAEGLDANRYGLFCSDTWWEKEELVEYQHLDAPRLERVVHHTPVEGATEITQLGVRYEELLAFVIAAM